MATARKTPVTGSFGATGTTAPFVTREGFNISLSGFGDATVELQRSFNAGISWLTVESYTADMEKRVDDPESGVWYRFECTIYSSGTITYRISG